MQKIKIALGSFILTLDESDGYYDLTELWKQAGCDKSKWPDPWLRQKGTKEYLQTLNSKTPPVRQTKGPCGSICANWMVAIEYARYLSPELNVLINEHFALYLKTITLKYQFLPTFA
jgi:hypothetical protein